MSIVASLLFEVWHFWEIFQPAIWGMEGKGRLTGPAFHTEKSLAGLLSFLPALLHWWFQLCHLPPCHPAKAAWCLQGSDCRNGGHHYSKKCYLFTTELLCTHCLCCLHREAPHCSIRVRRHRAGKLFSSSFSSSCCHSVLWMRPWTYHPNRRML